MDCDKVKNLAEALESVLKKYSQSDPEVAGLFESLRSLIQAAKAGKIDAAMEWRDIPGGRYFTEGTLRKYRDLEKSFAEFKIEITGGM